MNKKNIVYFVAILAIVGGLVSLLGIGQSSLPSKNLLSEKAGQLTALEPSFNLGTISMAKGKVAQVFKVKNMGTAPITVNKIFTSCMCTTATISLNGVKEGPFGMPGHTAGRSVAVVIAPGETAEVEAVFDPAAHGPAGTGKIRRVVYIETDSASKKVVELSFEANVTP